MNIYDLTLTQLKRAVALKEQISKLGDELRGIFDGVAEKITRPKKPTMSASAKKKIAAAQRARWAKLRRSKAATGQPASTVVRKTNASANARRSAKLKAYWAAKKRAAKR
jgi:hypothetical protein